jgi:predicted NAD/FAD-binding protein
MGVIDAADDRPVGVTYWMNRLQNLDPSYPVFVSLNPILEPDPRLVLDEVQYDHPQFDAVSERAQRRLGDIQGADRIWFSGAYAGHGFHEDGLQAGLTVAAALGSPAPWADRITPMSSAAEHAAPRMIRVGS